MQVPGARPWLAGLVSSALRTDSARPDLTGCHGQVLDVTPDGREAVLYDGEHTIRTVLSSVALRELAPTAGDGGHARLLHGRTVAPVDAVLVPDVLASPAAVTLVLRRVTVFANSIAHRPIRTPPGVGDHPDVRRALRAMVARHIAGCVAPDEAAEVAVGGGRGGDGGNTEVDGATKGSDESDDEDMEDANECRSMSTSDTIGHFAMPPAALCLEEVFIPPPQPTQPPVPPLRIPASLPHANAASKPSPASPRTPPQNPVNGVTSPVGGVHPGDDERSTVTIPSPPPNARPLSPVRMLSPPPATPTKPHKPSTLDNAERINTGQPVASGSLPDMPMTQHDAGAASESEDEEYGGGEKEDSDDGGSELIARTISTPPSGPSQASRPSQASVPSQGGLPEGNAPVAVARSPVLSTASPLAPATETGVPAVTQKAAAASPPGLADAVLGLGTPEKTAAASPLCLASPEAPEAPEVPETPVRPAVPSPAGPESSTPGPIANPRASLLSAKGTQEEGAAEMPERPLDDAETPEKPPEVSHARPQDDRRVAGPIANPRSRAVCARTADADRVEVPATDETAEAEVEGMEVDVGAANAPVKVIRPPSQGAKKVSPPASLMIRAAPADAATDAMELYAGATAHATNGAGHPPNAGAPVKQPSDARSPAAAGASPAATAGMPASTAEALAMQASTEEASDPAAVAVPPNASPPPAAAAPVEKITMQASVPSGPLASEDGPVGTPTSAKSPGAPVGAPPPTPVRKSDEAPPKPVSPPAGKRTPPRKRSAPLSDRREAPADRHTMNAPDDPRTLAGDAGAYRDACAQRRRTLFYPAAFDQRGDDVFRYSAQRRDAAGGSSSPVAGGAATGGGPSEPAPNGDRALFRDTPLARAVAKQVRWKMFAHDYLARMARDQPSALEVADESILLEIAVAERRARAGAGGAVVRLATAHMVVAAEGTEAETGNAHIAALVPESAPF